MMREYKAQRRRAGDNPLGVGVIAVGSDADLALWDPDREVTITNGLLHHACDHTPYEGRRLRGWPVTTISPRRGTSTPTEIMFVAISVSMGQCACSRRLSRRRTSTPEANPASWPTRKSRNVCAARSRSGWNR